MKLTIKHVILILTAVIMLSSCSSENGSSSNTGSDISDSSSAEETMQFITNPIRLPQGKTPKFSRTAVHDPSILEVDGTYYLIGSHMQAAKSTDLMVWTQISSGLDSNTLFKDVRRELGKALQWTTSDTFWAGDWIQLSDGKFYMYYCACQGSSPLSCIGRAVADNIEGPYTDLGIFMRSGVSGFTPDNGGYDPNTMPNAIDPHVFYDNDGKLWMVYGSYSGGIFILQMDPETGLPKPDQGWGKKLTGGYHVPIEGPYILYSPDTEYYYLFTSYGGLSYDAGYNIRVSRSKNPDGPYEDSEGKQIINAAAGSSGGFDTSKIQDYGVKLFGNYTWTKERTDIGKTFGYVSPGHNSAYYNAETGQYFLIFHTRFPGQGEYHEIRVHQMFLNEDGWFTVAPFRYGGENINDYKYTGENIIGAYKFVNHGKNVTSDIVKSIKIKLNGDYTVTNVKTGEKIGSWRLEENNRSVFEIDGEIYKGVFLFQWDDSAGGYTMTFSALSEKGVSIWGTQVYVP